MNVGELLTNSATQYPDKTAIIFRDQPTTYAELNQRANQVANALIGLGVQKGDRVGHISDLSLTETRWDQLT